MTYPVSFPNPNPVVPGVTINKSSSLAQIVAYLNSIGYNGAAFQKWYLNGHVTLDPYDASGTWLIANGIGTGLQGAVGATGAATGQIAQGTTNGLENISKDVLGGFNLGSWFMRIGEILLGLVLIGVGIARITGAQNLVSKAVRTKLP